MKRFTGQKKIDGGETAPVLALCRQKFPQYFKGHLGFFRCFNIYLFIYMFILRFLAEPWLENTALMAG